ncbi:MAG: signal peptide peptidase SppA [Rhizobiales bacterium]|jgi:protease-4|nr:signal peptide peptidase SppA [Hyphomicrobiales bacterium]
MSDVDFLVERRHLKSSRARWRMLAFVISGLAVIGAGWLALGKQELGDHTAHVARIDIKGVITGDKQTLDVIKRVKDSKAKAAMVVIDSPGGTVTGSDALYQALRDLTKTMPVVAVVDGTAASGGYIAALSADQIIARRTAIVGSIGVLFQYPNVVKLLDTLGVKFEGVKSSPLKAAPNPVELTTPEAQAALEAVVMDTFGWFKELVQERRHMSDDELKAVSDGRIYTGKQGLALRLVDRLGDDRDAISWLEQEKGLDKGLKIRRYKPERDLDRFGLLKGLAGLSEWMGLGGMGSLLRHLDNQSEAVVLDGLLVLWHPEASHH